MMDVIIIRNPETGEPIAAIKNVGTEIAWEAIDGHWDGHLFSNATPLYEDPEEFLRAQGRFKCDRCNSWQHGQCVCYSR